MPRADLRRSLFAQTAEPRPAGKPVLSLSRSACLRFPRPPAKLNTPGDPPLPFRDCRMKYVSPCLCLLGMIVPAAAADGPTLKEARQRWLRGNYEEARGKYETLAQDAKQKVPATIGLSRALQSQGEYDKALS